MLGEMRQQWSPQAFITSFKLETDERLLIKKVRPQCQAEPTARFAWQLTVLMPELALLHA